jgi:preprotein translocase subunit SecG
MQNIILFVHMLAAACIIILVLLQHGKGADAGAGFGSGASGTVFGAQGSTPFLMKLTAFLAVIFFITSITLAYRAAHTKTQSSSQQQVNSILGADKTGFVAKPATPAAKHPVVKNKAAATKDRVKK